jgi:hypothetical protein
MNGSDGLHLVGLVMGSRGWIVRAVDVYEWEEEEEQEGEGEQGGDEEVWGLGEVLLNSTVNFSAFLSCTYVDGTALS